jgi:hypothetical protein
MYPHHRAIDHLHLAAMGLGDGIHQPLPDARLAPSVEAIVSARVGPVALWQVAPRRSRPQHPENAVHDPPVVLWLAPRTPLGQDRLDDAPLKVCEIVPHDQAPQLQSLNHCSLIEYRS